MHCYVSHFCQSIKYKIVNQCVIVSYVKLTQTCTKSIQICFRCFRCAKHLISKQKARWGNTAHTKNIILITRHTFFITIWSPVHTSLKENSTGMLHFWQKHTVFCSKLQGNIFFSCNNGTFRLFIFVWTACMGSFYVFECQVTVISSDSCPPPNECSWKSLEITGMIFTNRPCKHPNRCSVIHYLKMKYVICINLIFKVPWQLARSWRTFWMSIWSAKHVWYSQ